METRPSRHLIDTKKLYVTQWVAMRLAVSISHLSERVEKRAEQCIREVLHEGRARGPQRRGEGDQWAEEGGAGHTRARGTSERRGGSEWAGRLVVIIARVYTYDLLGLLSPMGADAPLLARQGPECRGGLEDQSGGRLLFRVARQQRLQKVQHRLSRTRGRRYCRWEEGGVCE
jgi:hypothetical protein